MYSNNLSVDQPLWSSLSFIFAALTIQACFEEGSVYNVRVDGELLIYLAPLVF